MEQKSRSDGTGAVLLWIITIALLIFTAARSVHLIQSTMPDDSKVLAYAALAGLDGGVLAWLFWTTRAARGGVQHTIGSLMIIVDLAGIAAAVLGDTMLVANAGNKELVATVAVWLVPVVIVSNIGATIVAHLMDPAQALRDAERAVRDEIDRQTAETLVKNAGTVASQVAAARARHHAEQTVASLQPGSLVGSFSPNGKENNIQTFAAQGAPKAHRRTKEPAPPTPEL